LKAGKDLSKKAIIISKDEMKKSPLRLPPCSFVRRYALQGHCQEFKPDKTTMPVTAVAAMPCSISEIQVRPRVCRSYLQGCPCTCVSWKAHMHSVVNKNAASKKVYLMCSFKKSLLLPP
jgi:hypothetical protein